MHLPLFNEARRTWFKRSLDFLPRKTRPDVKLSSGWGAFDAFYAALAREKEVSKDIARKCRYTVGDPYASEVRAKKRLWFANL